MSSSDTATIIYVCFLLGLAAIVIAKIFMIIFIDIPKSNAEWEANEAKLNEQAKIECVQQHFYDNNFERCEKLGISP